MNFFLDIIPIGKTQLEHFLRYQGLRPPGGIHRLGCLDGIMTTITEGERIVDGTVVAAPTPGPAAVAEPELRRRRRR